MAKDVKYGFETGHPWITLKMSTTSLTSAACGCCS